MTVIPTLIDSTRSRAVFFGKRACVSERAVLTPSSRLRSRSLHRIVREAS